jgi:hypothetical protein
MKSFVFLRADLIGLNIAKLYHWSCVSRWFMVANAIVFVYSVLGATISFCAICVRRGPLSYSPTAWLTFLVDFVSPSKPPAFPHLQQYLTLHDPENDGAC